MAQRAGNYSDRFVWKKRTATKNLVNGQEEEVFTDNGTLWGVLDDATGQERTDYGGEQTAVDATIRIRQWPALSALDRLFLPEWGELWIIDSIARGDNELMCRVHKYDDLNL